MRLPRFGARTQLPRPTTRTKSPQSSSRTQRIKLTAPRGLRPRLIVAFLLVAAVSALVTATLTFRQARQSILDRSQHSAVHDLRLQTSSLAPNLPAAPTDTDLRAFARQLDRAAGSSDWHTAVSRDGGPLIGATADVSRALRAATTKKGDAAFYERVEHGAGPRLVIGMPVGYTRDNRQYAGKPSGLVVYADLSLDRERTDISALTTAAWAGAIPALAFAVVPALFAARRVLRPVRRLRTAAEKITEGALDTRLDAVGKDELAALTGTFNTMAGALERNDTKLRRMEANSRRFAADVTHELRTPLAAMAAVTDALDEDARSGKLPADTADAVLLISDETRKLTTMVEDLMEMSRFDAGAALLHLDDVELGTLIHKTLQLRGWHDSPEIVTDLPGGSTYIRVDARRVDVVLANLIGNALRHGAAPVTVRASVTAPAIVGTASTAPATGTAPASGTAPAAATPRSLIIDIADSGTGIPDEVLTHVFDRFYKADTARTRSEGSGLGLAIAMENVRLHHGTLTAANLPAGGAVFTVTLPQPPPTEEEPS
ncbi:ATP-binding protein [Streptomyces sp. NPDC050617]|uniref:sensor histidine kinase n=1 Tax=Streptomyces sp. NPDC050617 TaxID=3154628 RepID=UPI0034305A56